MLDLPCKPYDISLIDYDYVAVKAPMFSFTRLRGADPTLGVEMSSTGEVACFGHDVQEAFLQALLATTFKLPTKGANNYILVSIAEDHMRLEFLEAIQKLQTMGYLIAATSGTADFYQTHGISVKSVAKPPAESNDSVVKLIKDRTIDLVINIPEGTKRSDEITSGYLMRRAAVDFGCSLITNMKCAVLFCDALFRNKALPCVSAQEYLDGSAVAI
jgi:carbamoyl-phosphate synthase/aspartate carbamoyltransferase